MIYFKLSESYDTYLRINSILCLYTVLEKLRKDYGVRVVATREYPGANLVINCEDSSQNTAICIKSMGLTQSLNQETPQPYTYSEATTTGHHHQSNNEQPSYVAIAANDPRIAGQEDSYSTRNANMNEQYETINPQAGRETVTSDQRELAQPEKAEVNSDPESGFEVQAAASEKIKPKQQDRDRQYRDRQ